MAFDFSALLLALWPTPDVSPQLAEAPAYHQLVYMFEGRSVAKVWLDWGLQPDPVSLVYLRPAPDGEARPGHCDVVTSSTTVAKHVRRRHLV